MDDEKEETTTTETETETHSNPPSDDRVSTLQGIVEGLKSEVEALKLQVESLTDIDPNTRDVAPVSIPWTARGRR